MSTTTKATAVVMRYSPSFGNRSGLTSRHSATAFRVYSLTGWRQDEGTTVEGNSDSAPSPPPGLSKKDLKILSQDYNNRRAEYRRQVSVMRKKYAEQVQKQRLVDQKAKEALERELTRKRLERQRLKNMKSAQNAIREKAFQQEQAKKFQEHLDEMQRVREAKEERFRRARQKVVERLEEEAPLWLTTTSEVENAFSHEATQLLWTRPHGVLGAPNPSLDAHFWQYETHTWLMTKTYKSRRQILLEDIEQMVYDEANIDASFWTPERVQEHEERERKARLRAMVRSVGRRNLRNIQRRMLNDASVTEKDQAPKPIQVPNNRILRNNDAIEKEGARLLMKDPTQFFVFEDVLEEVEADASETGEDGKRYKGPTLGSPVALRDRLREGNHQGRVFPIGIGRDAKVTKMTERERKQQEREDRLLQAALQADKEDSKLELAAEDQELEDLEPDLNYDEIEWDSDEETWAKGADPIADKDILDTPKEKRYSESDIEWVLGQLESKIEYFEREFGQDMESMKRRLESKLELDGAVVEGEKSLDRVLLNLPNNELFEISSIYEKFANGMSDDEFHEAAKSVPSLTEEELRFVLEEGLRQSSSATTE